MLDKKMVRLLIDLVQRQMSVKEFAGRFSTYLSELWQTPELTTEKEALADLEHVLEEVADGLLPESEVYPVAQEILNAAILALEQVPTFVISYGLPEVPSCTASTSSTVEDRYLRYQLA